MERGRVSVSLCVSGLNRYELSEISKMIIQINSIWYLGWVTVHVTYYFNEENIHYITCSDPPAAATIIMSL